MYEAWTAYDEWYYWAPGRIGAPWDMHAVGPFETEIAAQDAADAARAALSIADFNVSGGVTLAQVKRELGLS